MKIFVDSQGNWQEYQEWHDEVVMNEPDRFKIVEVEGLPNNMRSPKFSSGVFIEPPAVEYIPTRTEKIAYIKKYYDERFATLDQVLLRRRLINGDITDLQEQFKRLNLEMVAKIKGAE